MNLEMWHVIWLYSFYTETRWMEYMTKNYLFCARVRPTRIRVFEWLLYSWSMLCIYPFLEPINLIKYFQYWVNSKIPYSIYLSITCTLKNVIVNHRFSIYFPFTMRLEQISWFLSTIEKWQKIWWFRFIDSTIRTQSYMI